MNISEPLKYDCVLDLQIYDNNDLVKEIQAKNTVMATGFTGLYENLLSKDPLDSKIYGPISYCIFGTSTIAANVADTFDSFGAEDGKHRHVNKINNYNIGNKVKINILLEEYEFNIPAQLNPKLPIASVGLGFYTLVPDKNYIIPKYVFNRVVIAEEDRFFKTYSMRIGGSWSITIIQ
jgi:hypothetical protein